MKSFARFTFLLSLLGFAWSAVGLAQPVYAANPGDVLIIEVGADPTTGINEPAGEYIEIYNNTASAINLNNWTLIDNGATTITLPNISLDAGKILVIIADAATFGAVAGYNCANVPLHHQPAAWFSNNLGNNADRVLLRDELSNLIDAISYGTDITVFNPAAPDVFNNSGATLIRSGYNMGPFVDTDTAADWSASTGAGSPCDVTPTAVTLARTGANTAALPSLPFAFAFLMLAVASFVIGRRKA